MREVLRKGVASVCKQPDSGYHAFMSNRKASFSRRSLGDESEDTFISLARLGNKHLELWNKEYRTSEHLALSDLPSEDLEKFCRWAERNYGRRFLNPLARVLDLGCGNGRNLIFLAQRYGMRGVGYDISCEATKLAERASRPLRQLADSGGQAKELPIKYATRSIEGTLDIPDASVDIVLDMMTSHFLKEKAREALRAEILRVLKPGGWLFFKSFLADQDLHVRRLLKENPADEKDSYIHPKLGVYEHVWTEESLHEFFSPFFEIAKIERSHKHMRRGKAFKRRTITAYLQKLL